MALDKDEIRNILLGVIAVTLIVIAISIIVIDNNHQEKSTTINYSEMANSLTTYGGKIGTSGGAITITKSTTIRTMDTYYEIYYSSSKTTYAVLFDEIAYILIDN